MTRRFFSHVEVDPQRPAAKAICDKCGRQFQLETLRLQKQWSAGSLYNKGILVCTPCYDEPSEFLKVLSLPADPRPVYNARPEFYDIDEAGSFVPPPDFLRDPIDYSIVKGPFGEPIQLRP